MAALRAKDKGVGDVATDQNVLSKFREYDLEELGIPVSARPRVNSVYTGQHGYTIRSARGGATWYSKLVSVFFGKPGHGKKFHTKNHTPSTRDPELNNTAVFHRHNL